jgi:hypothetical protein
MKKEPVLSRFATSRFLNESQENTGADKKVNADQVIAHQFKKHTRILSSIIISNSIYELQNGGKYKGSKLSDYSIIKSLGKPNNNIFIRKRGLCRSSRSSI